MKRKHNFIQIIAVVLFLTFSASLLIPYMEYEEIIYKEKVTENYPFAGVLVYDGKRIGASTELCCSLWLGSQSEIPVRVSKYIWYTARTPISEK